MKFLLDTNAVSEGRKPRPNPGLMSWLERQNPASLFISVITLAEVWQGWHNLSSNHPDWRKIRAFAEGLPDHFRVLKFDELAAREWGRITARSKLLLPLRDSLIAATALSRKLTVVSRDAAPFQRAGCRVLNPWT